MMGWHSGGTSLIGWLSMGAFWLLLIAVVVWLVMRLLPGSDAVSRARGESALAVFDRRLASGEIDAQAWRSQRRVLLDAQRDAR